MLTKEQVYKLGDRFVYSLFTKSAAQLDLDRGRDMLVCGHCYYFADAMLNLLTESSYEDNIGPRIASFDCRHYFLEYDGNYFDGLGIIKHDDDTITLWDYENESHYKFPPETRNLKDIYYEGTNKDIDECHYTTITKEKSEIWKVYHIGVDPIIDEFRVKLMEASKISEEAFDKTIREFHDKAVSIIKSEKHRDPNNIGKVDQVLIERKQRIKEEEDKFKREHEKRLQELDVVWKTLTLKPVNTKKED